MNQLSTEKRLQILGMLVEGCSLRSTSRLANVSINTVTKLLVDVGEACARYQHAKVRRLRCRTLQVDELWTFCYARGKNVPEKYRGQDGYGDVWTWVAIDADTKLVPCWRVGDRQRGTALRFFYDLSNRMEIGHRPTIISDGYSTYIYVVEAAFGKNVDFAQLVKQYENEGTSRQRYKGAERRSILGIPDMKKVSTSYVERQNLTMRTHMKRYARKTNAHSKKIENHNYAVALHFMYYNFCRIHKTLRVTPAMEAGLSDHAWSLEEILSLTSYCS